MVFIDVAGVVVPGVEVPTYVWLIALVVFVAVAGVVATTDV